MLKDSICWLKYASQECYTVTHLDGMNIGYEENALLMYG
jgi:hypothetical protein